MDGAESGQGHHNQIWSLGAHTCIAGCSEMEDLLRAANLPASITASHIPVQGLDYKSNGIKHGLTMRSKDT